MHILYLYKDYWPVIGGIESHLRILAEGMAALGHQVSVVVCQPQQQSLASVEQHNGVAIYRVPRHVDVASSPFSFALPSIVRQLAPDVVHLQMPWPGGDVALWQLKTPFVVTYQSDVVRQHHLLRIYAPLLHHTLRRAQAIITTSPQYRDSSQTLQRYRDKCHVIPLAVPASAPVEASRVAYWQARFPEGCVLWVGRMRYYKGLTTLLDALARTPPSLHVALVGDGPLMPELHAQAHTLGLTARVHFLGALADADVRALQHIARFFVFPSQLRAEAFGLALLEALSAGLPAISCEIGTATSFVNQDGHTGIVVPPDDAVALAHAMHRLWSDDTMRRQYATHAVAWVNTQFSVPQMIETTLQLYVQSLRQNSNAAN